MEIFAKNGIFDAGNLVVYLYLFVCICVFLFKYQMILLACSDEAVQPV